MYIHIIVFIGIVGLNIIILGLVIYWYRNKMLSQYNSFLNKADEILGGKQIDMRYDESLDSAISERLNRILTSVIRYELLLQILLYMQDC